MEKGFLKIPRAFFEGSKWKTARAFSECEAWLDLLQSARFEASPTMSRIGGRKVAWGQGQYPASVRFLARKWGRPERWVRSFLARLKREGRISVDDSQGTGVITVAGYAGTYAAADTAADTAVDTANGLCDNTLNGQATRRLTRRLTQPDTTNVLDYNELREIATRLLEAVGVKCPENAAGSRHSGDTKKKKEEEITLEKPPIGGKETPARRFERFTEWLERNAPSVLGMRKPFTEREFLKLRSLYDFDELESVLTDMENKPSLRDRYKSAYLTCRKWLERDFGRRDGGVSGGNGN